MVNRSWLLTALVGMVLIYEATAINCIICADTDTDQTCAQGTGKTPSSCTNTDDVCYMRNNGNKIERGCLKDLPVADQSNCAAVEGQSCMTCPADGCNSATWVKCHKCVETTNTCTNEQELTGASVCSKYVKEDQCYAKVDGNEVTRGCKSDLPATNDGCTNNKYCDVCSGDGCNSLSGEKLRTFPKCLICKSTDAKCIDASSPAVECDKRDDTCFTRLQANVLERGCLSTLTIADQNKCKDDQDATCLACTDAEACNKQNWLMCHQCKETDAATCAEVQTDDKAQFCKTYKDGNQCYERLESTKIVRGCVTDLAINENPCKDNTECRQCPANACNKEAAATLLNTDRCIQCSTSVDADGSCLSGKAASQPCAKPSEKKCYAKTDTEGVLTRGCQGDLTADEIKACTGKMCEICEAEKCTKIFPTDRLRCYQCNSGSDKTCSDQLTGEPKSNYCKVYKAGDQCYARIVNNVFERGCQSDLKAAACDGLGGKECTTCTTENCNQVSEDRLKNSAGQKAASSILVASAVALIIFK
ncbi:proprotein convertase subtilisin/kexin type 5-like [Ochlerotatus camptorhynchus]|uniref:proprotein convertase subtilisin/kexin type 5-like n=1 Tax=Ochlerotatus camptorhynchus TaxID=644619 RepID=UPI0031D5EE9D